MSHAQQLRKYIAASKILIAPGGSDGLSGHLIESAGFQAMYLSGASIAYTRFGLPDIGLVSMAEVASTLSVIRERVDLPIIVDADTGFGNALNVQRTVKLFERHGASAIQLEDQQLPKRCGHLAGKSLISKAEMVGKIHSALDARNNPNTLIIARTDGIAVDGIDAAMDRAHAYVDAGADMLFVEAPKNMEQMQRICGELSSRIPLLANMVEGGDTPISSAKDLQSMGYSLVIFPGALVRASTHASMNLLAYLKQHGNTDGMSENMLNLKQLNEVLETEKTLARGEAYAESKFLN
ncbi:MAG: 2-methylisocitrate lyase-like PEP mutase family enzyme [Pseudohongiellaceae bacterium]|jgi:2-methylisocitrate lyase-like PEP mutase family enzyme